MVRSSFTSGVFSEAAVDSPKTTEHCCHLSLKPVPPHLCREAESLGDCQQSVNEVEGWHAFRNWSEGLLLFDVKVSM